jgi:hypothetical protein
MTGENPDWDSATEARLPEADLSRLTQLRDRPDIRVRLSGASAWVTWSSSRAEVVRALMPVRDVVFFRTERGARYRLGDRIPMSEAPPDGEDRSLSGALLPSPLHPLPSDESSSSPVQLQIVRGGSPQPTSALLCGLDSLRAFADTATTAELAAMRGILSGDRAVLFGAKLPPIAGAARLYGTDVLLPVGFRAEPDLPPAVLLSAVGAEPGETLILTEDGWELVPVDLAEPLTRAGMRLALSGAFGT